MEKLIAGVRAEPCLWNPVHSDYREVIEREEAWQRVVDHCDSKAIPDVKAARASWRKLRDNHREALKRAKLGRNKLLPAQITTWKYAKAMQFLEPYMKYRITDTIETDAPDEKELQAPDQDVSNDGGKSPQDQPSPAQKRRYNDNTNDPTQRPQLSSEPQLSYHQVDALESFFSCMMKSTREMPQWMQTQVKKKIFAVIIEAEEQLSSTDKDENTDIENLNSLTTTNTIIKSEVFTEDSCEYD